MTLKECYRLLELPKSADLDEIKKAYRRLAFELHPDLNPDKPDAVQRFQAVNEAYVLLTHTLQDESKRDPRVSHRKDPEKSREGAKPGPQRQAKEHPHKEHVRPKEQEQAGPQNREQARTGATEGSGAGRAASSTGKHGFTGSTGPSASRPKAGNSAGVFGQAGPRSDQYGPSGSDATDDFAASSFDPNRVGGNLFNRTDSGADASSRSSRVTPPPQGGRGAASGNAYVRQEEVLGEILNDPFARRVFEDIYSELKRERPQAGNVTPPRAVKPKPVKKKKKLSLEWGGRRMSLDLTHGISGAVKSWLRGQLDQEQVLEMPAAGIVPGARIRLQVHVGIMGQSQSVEVTLPPDYLPGMPIRLKGLGRKLGGWRGDLYLRVVPQGSRLE